MSLADAVMVWESFSRTELILLGSIGEADDIGGVVAFLCTKNAKRVNVQRMEASGGIFL
ncbi:hypothetical protein [Fluviispira sanaruensis]|nr:hypothetical protein [Fluviispira sanaruensis]